MGASLAFLLLGVSLWMSVGCERCALGSLAVLTTKQGGADRDFAAERDKWHVADVGARFRAGDGLKTALQGTAKLALEDGSVLELENDTLVRFLEREPGSHEIGLDVLMGTAAFEVAAQGGTLRTSLGRGRVEGGSRLLMKRVHESISFQVSFGAAHIESKEGSVFDLQAGEKVLVSEGSVKLELAEGRRAAEELPRGPVEGTLPSGDVDLVAGSNVIVHDPEPPTKVRFLFGAICNEAVVRFPGLDRPQMRGQRGVSEPFGEGTYPYAVHCVDASGQEEPKAQGGTVTILKDSGLKTIAPSPPSTLIEVNGRQYTVLYQSQLPQLAFRWSDAPPGATDIKLYLSTGGKTRTLASPSSTYGFASGALSEGTYQAYFEGGGQISPRTVVAIAFDNATPIATFSGSDGGRVSAGSSITVSGSALPGWSVTIDGQPLGQDAEGRFSAMQKVPEKGRPIAVELSHAERDRHVYLRRPSGAL